MLKHEIPAIAPPSIWTKIKSLRTSDPCFLAPGMQSRVRIFEENARQIETITYKVGNTERTVRFDPVVFETWRPDELQRIYYEQGTTGAQTAIYGWHFYGLAVDVISASMEWSCPHQWWVKMGTLGESAGLDWGGRWRKPDLPHLQFGTVRGSPSDYARELYFGTKNWHGLSVYSDHRHIDGLRRVWKVVGAM